MGSKDDGFDTLLTQGVPEASGVVSNTTALWLVSTSNQGNAFSQLSVVRCLLSISLTTDD